MIERNLCVNDSDFNHFCSQSIDLISVHGIRSNGQILLPTISYQIIAIPYQRQAHKYYGGINNRNGQTKKVNQDQRSLHS